MAWSFYRSITIDHTKVGSSNSTNFPVLVSGTYSYLATTGNGGSVTNANGYDIGFYSDAGLTTKLNWEVELYTAATGQVIYWVQVPSVSSSTSTVFYIAYGNSSITTNQSNTSGTWSNSFKAVYHLENGTTLSPADATGTYPGTIVGSLTATTGKIDGAMTGTGTGVTAYVQANSGPIVAGTSAWSVSAWINTTTTNVTGGQAIYTERASGAVNDILKLDSCDGPNPNNVLITYRNDGSSLTQVRTSSANIADGNWHHACMTLNAGTFVLYVDGVGGTPTARNGNDTLTDSMVATIGADYNVPTQAGFNGSIDELRLSSVARSADWITAEYNNQSSPSTFYALGAQTAFTGSSYPPSMMMSGM